jgi:hypothetical protein
MPCLIVVTIPRRERSNTDMLTAAKNVSKHGKKTANVRKACASFQPCPMSLWDIRPSLPLHTLAVTYEETFVGLPHIGQAPHPYTNRCSHTFYHNASSNALASCKSAVSNPSVNQLYTGVSRARASSRFHCCYHSRPRLITARNSRDLAC